MQLASRLLPAVLLVLAGCDGGRRVVCSGDVQCSAGETLCTDGALRACAIDANGCSSWATPSTCPSGACAGDGVRCATCTDTCADGEASCSNGLRSVCTLGANGCRAPVVTACPSGFCDGAACGACTNACPGAGATACAGGQLRTCTADTNGCLAWAAASACGSGFCADATSCGTCTDGCTTTGATECTSGQLRTCVADANGCRAWSAPSACGAGFCGSPTACGACTDGCTTTGATECTSGQLRTCVADANGCRAWSAPSSCGSGFCGSATACGTCTHGCPSVGATDCTAGALRTCVADGNGCRAWSAPSACGSGFCASATACGTCTHGCPSAGATECTGGQLRTCVADANGCRAWGAASACPSGFCGTAQSCGSCTNTCPTSGETSCASGALSTCTADVNGCLAWGAPVACSGPALCRSATQCDRAPLASLSCTSPVVQGTSTTLDASGSSDPDGDPLSYRYTLPDGGAFDGGATAQVLLAVVGTSGFSVRVSDPAGASATASCSVQVTCAAETDQAFCARHGKDCNAFSGTDNCGAPRTASCGACTLPQVCGLATANVCGTPDPALIPAPRQVKPMSLSTVARPRPTFRWVLAAGADGAQVEICPDRACATPSLTFAATGTSAVPPVDLAGRVIFWRLRGRSGTTLGTATSPVWQCIRRAGTGADTSFGHEPDFDNDGFADAVISAYNEPKTWFYRGGTNGLLSVSTLALGFTELDGAGDVNGDGFGDVVLGNRVHLGSASGIVTTAYQALTYSGFSWHRSAGVGDVDGDGYADLANVYGTSPVRLDLWRGGPGGVPAAAAQSLSIGSNNQWSVSAAGDVNGDGYADVVVHNCRRNLTSCGGDAWVFLGGASGFEATSGWSVLGTNELSVSSPGDFNADGYADLAVSDWSNVWIYLGSPTGLGATPHRTLARPNTSGYWGMAVELADITGDGLDDLIVGDPQSEVVKPYSAPNLTGLTQVAESTSDDFDLGSVMATAGDVNGDGRVDVLVGAPSAPVAATWERAWLFFGNASGFDRTNAASDIFYGTTRNRQFGYALR